DQTTTLHRRRNRKAPRPRLHNAVTPPVSRGTFEGTCGSKTKPRHLCATSVVEGHRQADQTTTLHHRRNRKAPHNRDRTTPRHHLCRGYIRKVARGRDDATAPMCHWRSCRAPPSRDAPREHSTTTHTPSTPDWPHHHHRPPTSNQPSSTPTLRQAALSSV
uniref:Uncharacterized protein n=1 Tax=Triticum urartu TaxID=4572 RepID=A0A8R7K468_TRIUA